MVYLGSRNQHNIKIYSVGVWNFYDSKPKTQSTSGLKFTPLEFETRLCWGCKKWSFWLKFTPLEFETKIMGGLSIYKEYH